GSRGYLRLWPRRGNHDAHATPLRSAAVVAVAAFTGLRKEEISALMWEHYRDGLLYVEKSKWRTHITNPKTRKSKAPVPVIARLRRSWTDGAWQWGARSRAGCSVPVLFLGGKIPCFGPGCHATGGSVCRWRSAEPREGQPTWTSSRMTSHNNSISPTP